MTGQLLDLPINIPSGQIAVSRNMIDTRIGSSRFQPPWQSSPATAAYEPVSEDAQEGDEADHRRNLSAPEAEVLLRGPKANGAQALTLALLELVVRGALNIFPVK